MSKEEAQYPKHYLGLKKSHPKLIDAVGALGIAVKEAGPVDAKTAHLIQLAAAVGIRAEGAVHSHTLRARDAGASPQEIRHAVILLTSTVGFPTVAAALSWVNDILEPEE